MTEIKYKLNWFVRAVTVASLLVGTFGIQSALAGRPDALKDTLSDSVKSDTAIHTISLDQATGTVLAAGETVTITFPSGFTLPSFTASDATFSDNGSSKTVQTTACGSTDTVRLTQASQTVTFTACNSYSGTSGSVLLITVGGASNKITNNSVAASYTITVAGSYGDDSQDTQIAIVDGVTVSATVGETLTFTVAGVTSGTCDTTGGTKIDTSGSATTVPFSTVNSDTFYDACQSLTVGTNGAGGYTTTVQTQAAFSSGANSISKGTCDGSCTDSTGAAWATASGNNGYGYCMKDVTGTAANTMDGTGWGATHQCGAGSQFFKTVANIAAAQSAVGIMKSTGPTSSNNVSRIGYRLDVSSGQAAGSYSTVVDYIATPTF